jgi:hypothetical protein
LRTRRGWKRSAGALAAVLFASGAHGAHPLNTEDTGTQGKGRWQLELNGERNRDRVGNDTVRGGQAAAVLSYGLAETLDVQAGVPWLDTGPEQGAADPLAAVKWRFWEREAWSAGVRAGITVPTGDEEKGLGNGRATWAALLIGQYEGERWIFLSHLGYRRNWNTLGNRESLAEISGAVLYRATESLKLLVDASRITNADRASDTGLRHVVVGAIYSVAKAVDLDVGLRDGNDPAIDRALMLGITLCW